MPESGRPSPVTVLTLKAADHPIVTVLPGRVTASEVAEVRPLPKSSERQNKIAEERGFAIRDHALYLYADCTRESCPNRETSE